MHKSQLGGFIIDCQVDDLESASVFWSQALGYAIKPSTLPEDDGYVLFDTSPGELHIELQRVDHPSRVHLDIETDNVEAEVQRLEGLGAVRVIQVRDWWVLEAPTGHRFCVIPRQRSNFDEQANTWE